jgi:hypothetical protein
MPVSDNSIMLRTATDGLLNLAASVETTTGVHVGEGPIQGMKLRIYCPLGAGTTPTLDIVLMQGETLGGTYYAVPGGAVPQIVAAGTYEHHVHWTMPYLQLVSTITGTNADFGLATVGLEEGRIATT